MCVRAGESSHAVLADSPGCFISVLAFHNGETAGVRHSETEHTTLTERDNSQTERRNTLRDCTAVNAQRYLRIKGTGKLRPRKKSRGWRMWMRTDIRLNGERYKKNSIKRDRTPSRRRKSLYNNSVTHFVFRTVE